MAEREDAKRAPRGRKEALILARQVDNVIVAKGKKVVTFSMKKNPPDDETLAAHLLGPTGNLRAPAVRRGKTLFVGFEPASYGNFLGG